MKYLSAALILASAGTCISSPAFAYRHFDYEPNYYNNFPRDTIYISGNVGLGRLSTPEKAIDPINDDWITSTSYNNESIAAGGTIGFKHALSRQFLLGTEAGYDYNGVAKYTENYKPNYTWTESTTYRISSQDIHLLATGTLLFSNGFNIFAKGGAARVDQKLRVTNAVDYTVIPLYLGETSIVRYKPMAVAGFGFQLQAVDIYAQYSHIFAKDAKNFEDFIDQYGFTDIVSVDTFKVGLGVHVKV
jgi:hypothetical protein